MQSQLEQLEKDYGIEWQEYEIGALFEKLNLKFLKAKFDKDNDVSKEKTLEFDLPLVNAKDGSNGIMYYGRSEDFDSSEMTIDIVNDGAVSTGNVYSQPQKTGVLYNAYLIKPLFSPSKELLHFFTTTIQKSIKLKFGYENKAGWEKVKTEKIQLPTITKNGKPQIAFDFMEQFIATLNAERLATLNAYLMTTGLNDYNLTAEEQAALDSLDKVVWSMFKIVSLFSVKNTHCILSRDIVKNSGNIPYLTAGQTNNSVGSYINFDKNQVDEGNCIFIGGKTFVVTYQENDFFSNDSHNLALYYKDSDKRTKSNQLFMAASIYKSLSPLYSWGDSISNKKIQKDTIQLPTKSDNTPDYDYMSIVISAMQKVVIKNVVLYADKQIAATEKIINQGNE